MMDRVSIIILSKNGGNKLADVIDSVLRSENPPCELLVIDSGSSDGSLELISGKPARIIEIPPEAFSHGGTRNMAAKLAEGDTLVFLTQDAVPGNKNWLDRLISPLSDPLVAGTFARQIPSPGASPIESFFCEYVYPAHPVVKSRIDPSSCALADIFFSNVCSAMKKRTWEKYPFNEDLIMSEDQEWAKRVLLDGKKVVYVPEAEVYHSHRYSPIELIRRNFDSGMSLRGLVNAPPGKAVSQESDYLLKGIRYLAERGHYVWLFLFPFYEFFRVLGFTAGFNSDILPLSLRRKLSQHKHYWKV